MYGTRSKTQTSAVFEASDIGKDNMAYSRWRSLANSYLHLGCELKMVPYIIVIIYCPRKIM